VFIVYCFFLSCKNYKIVDLSDKIKLPTVACNNNDIDFFIQEIILVDADRSSLKFELFGIKAYKWREHLPDITIRIKIKNKSDKTLHVDLGDTNFQSDIVGIIKTTKDTVIFVNFFETKVSIDSKDDNIIEISANCLDFPSFEFDNYNEFGDNTDMMLSFVKDMEFYYIPIKKDTLKNNNYCIGISPKTKIISHSRIR